MALPGITSITQVDGSLGLVPTNDSGLQIKLGTAFAGNYNTIYSFSNIKDAYTTLQGGKLLDSAAVALDIAGGPVYVMRMATSVAGSFSDIAVKLQTLSDGALALSGTPIDDYIATIAIVRAGKVGTQPYPTFTYSLDSNLSQSAEIAIPGSGTYVIPGTGITLTFSNGAVGFKAGDTFSFTTVGSTWNNTDLSNALTALLTDSRSWGFLHVVGSATAALAGTVDTFMNTAFVQKRFVNAIVETRDIAIRADLTTSGNTFPMTMTAGQFLKLNISYDGGITIAKTATFTFPTVTYANVAALLAAINLPSFTQGDFSIGVSGSEIKISTLSNKGLTTITVDATSTAIDPTRIAYTAGQVSTGETEDAWMTAIITDFSNFNSNRVDVEGGNAYIFSSATSRYNRRPGGWLVAARQGLVSISEDLGNVQRGSLPNIIVNLPDGSSGLVHDEEAKPGLDAARFSTLRKIKGLPGYYITNGRMYAAPGSDYTYTQYRRVIDRGTLLLYTISNQYINTSVLVNEDGTIYEVDARAIEAKIYSYVYSDIGNHITGLTVQVDRTNNVLSTQTIKIRLNIRPFGYAKFIELTIGFTPVSALVVS